MGAHITTDIQSLMWSHERATSNDKLTLLIATSTQKTVKATWVSPLHNQQANNFNIFISVMETSIYFPIFLANLSCSGPNATRKLVLVNRQKTELPQSSCCSYLMVIIETVLIIECLTARNESQCQTALSSKHSRKYYC